jgi:cytochrome c oxidase cbb3-type subunit 3
MGGDGEFMKRTRMFVWMLFGSLVAAGPAMAQQSMDNPSVGKHMYRSYCGICHGNDGKTRGPLAEKLDIRPANLTDPRYQKMTVEDLSDLIGQYSPKEGTQMPKWGEALPEDNIRKIASYLHLLSQPGLRFSGNTRRGREIFQSSCSACHGPRGKGNGVLARLLNVKMVDFTEQPLDQWIKDEEILKVVRDGRGEFMPAWKGTLSEDEITDVAAYVRSLGR